MRVIARACLLSVFMLASNIWLSVETLSAAPVTREQARQNASQFVGQRGLSLKTSNPFRAPRTETVTDEDNAYYYVFDLVGDGGYVIVSGDDRTEQILGFVDHGTFDEANMSEGLRWLLQTYQEQIQKLGNAPLPGTASGALISPARHTVEPLMTTRWNQGYPYNILCPRYINNDGTDGDPSATGCVATAIAQVMGYYRYPAETKRYIPSYDVEYDTDNGKVKKRINGIPAHSVIDWDNILDEYHGSETALQDTAIAQLMLWVGVGCKMGYGPSSGAGFSAGVNALINYFGYDDGTHIAQRGNYTIEGWSSLLYTEIATGHPIAFAGTNTGGAHAFVLDGYDISGLFHLNWGWGGMDDGYFRVDVLAPDNSSGIGASQTPDGYNMGQEAIIGLRLPDDERAPTVQPRLTVNDWELRGNNRFFANYVNWSGVSASWDTGIAYVGDDGSFKLIGAKQTDQLNDGYYVGKEFEVRGLSPGTYHMVPVSKRSSQRVWQSDVNPAIVYILVTVDEEGNVSLEKHPIEAISLVELDFPGSHKVGEQQRVRAVFRNNGEEYSREIHLLASLSDDKGEGVCRTQVTIAEGGESISGFTFTPDAPGLWTVWLSTDRWGNNIVGQGTVEITLEGVPPAHHLRYASHSITNRSNGVVYGNRMQGRVTILNQDDEPFVGNVRLWLFKQENGMYYGDASFYVPLTIEPRKTAQAMFDFDHLELNTTYAMSILYEEGGDIQDGGLKPMGRTQAGIVYWQQNKQLGGMAPSKTVKVPSGAVAVDLSCAGNVIQTVQVNENPNTLYILSANGQWPEGLEGRNVVRGNVCERLQLTDDYGFWSPLVFTAAHAEYRRVAEEGWATIGLPFTANALPLGVTLKEFTEQDEEGSVCFDVSSSLQRNMPYLIHCANDGEFVFEGTNVRVSSSKEAPMVVGTNEHHFMGTTLSMTFNPNDIYDLDAENGCFRLIDERTTIKPFRAWFVKLTEEEYLPSEISFDTEVPVTPTGLESRCDTAAYGTSGAVYDLQGRVMERGLTPVTPHRFPLKKGIYVVNGKKVVIH